MTTNTTQNFPDEVTGTVISADQITPGMTVRMVTAMSDGQWFVGRWHTIATVERLPYSGAVHLRAETGRWARGHSMPASDQFEVRKPIQDEVRTPTAAERVTALRAAGRTVRQVAEMVGVSVSTIYRWMRGTCQPRPINAIALADLA